MSAGESDRPPSGEGNSPDPRGETGDGVMAAGVDRISHQLKNPLQSISVNLEVLRLRAARHAPPEEVEEIDRLAGVVEEGVRLLDRRVGMLVDLARRASDGGWRHVALGAFVRQAAATFQLDEREGGGGIEVQVPDPEEDVEVRIRPGWLLAALLEAADALPAEEAGRRVLRVDVREGRGRLQLPVESGDGGHEEPSPIASLREAVRRAGGEPNTMQDRMEVWFPES